MSWLSNIKDKIYRRVPELRSDENLCEDLIDEAFVEIVKYSNANSYDRLWDSVLVKSVCMLYNTIGTEGSTYRSSLGVSDKYDSTDILATYLQANIKQYIKPVGYVYSQDRFKFPE